MRTKTNRRGSTLSSIFSADFRILSTFFAILLNRWSGFTTDRDIMNPNRRICDTAPQNPADQYPIDMKKANHRIRC